MDGWVNVGRGKDWVKIPRKSSRQLFIVFIIEHPMTTIIMRKNRELGALRHLKREGLKTGLSEVFYYLTKVKVKTKTEN